MMDKNEAWATMVAGINCPDVAPTEKIALIQLDAFKAGMARAAEIVTETLVEQCDIDVLNSSIIEERDSLKCL